MITTYPKPLKNPTLRGWQAPPLRSDSKMYVICSTQFLTDKLTKSFKLSPARVIRNVGRPVLTAFFAAGFSFQRGVSFRRRGNVDGGAAMGKSDQNRCRRGSKRCDGTACARRRSSKRTATN